MQQQEDYKARFDEVEKSLQGSYQQWIGLEDKLEDATETFLLSKTASWKKWFDLEEAELHSDVEGGLRRMIRERIHSLLLGPIDQKLAQQVGVGSAEGNTRQPVHALQFLLEQWNMVGTGIVAEARAEDDKLAKKIRKTEKDERAKGIVALGMQDTKKVAALKRERAGIWEPAQKVLGKFAEPAKSVKELLKEEASDEAVARILTAVPVVTSRAVCDWYFQRCLLGLEELEKWWANTKAMLQSNEALWQGLQEQEGLLMRRVEKGIEDVGARRRTYPVYANFGGNEIEVQNLFKSVAPPAAAAGPDKAVAQPMGESALLLANEVAEMHRRLRQIRDSALWRVIEAAQEIHRQLVRSNPSLEEPSPWQGLAAEEGATVFIEFIEGSEVSEDAAPVSPTSEKGFDLGSMPPSPNAATRLEDATVLSMGRLEKLGAVALDLKGWLGEQKGCDSPPGEAARAVLDQVVSATSELTEDLLEVLDEPSVEAAEDWLRAVERRMGGAEGAAAAQRLEDAMAALKMQLDSALGPVARKARRRWLALMRGLQVFLQGGALQPGAPSLRARLLAPLAQVVSVDCMAPSQVVSPACGAAMRRDVSALTLQEVGDDLNSLSAPISPRPVSVGNNSYLYRPPERRMFSNSESGNAVPSSAPAEGGSGGLSARGNRPPIPRDSAPRTSLPGGLPDAAGALSFISASWRPDTPSTADPEEQREMARTPSKPYFVDGQYIPLRPGSGTGKRLAPLQGAPGTPGRPREAW